MAYGRESCMPPSHPPIFFCPFPVRFSASQSFHYLLSVRKGIRSDCKAVFSLCGRLECGMSDRQCTGDTPTEMAITLLPFPISKAV